MTHDEAIRTGATERYLLAEMPDDERDAFETHYFDCLVCADDVKAAFMIRDGLRAAKPAPAANVVPFTARVKKAVAPLAAAASLVFASLLGWVQFVRVPALNSALAAAHQPFISEDHTLDESRGVNTVIDHRIGNRLRVDLETDDRSPSYNFVVVDAAGDPKLTREINGDFARMQMVPYTIPPESLKPGTYTLRVDGTEAIVAKYPFTVR